jgi:hypothetical protein
MCVKHELYGQPSQVSVRTMVYLKDEATGVTVEDYGKSGTILVKRSHMRFEQHEPAEADALLRGLLRWKLETRESPDSDRIGSAIIKLLE